MNALTVAKSGRVETVPAGFEERLVWLCQFGKPRVSMLDTGWHASIQMNTNTTGTSFEVKSEFGNQTPSAAVSQLIERMLSALVALTPAGEGK